MASRKKEEPIPLTEALVSEVEARVRAARFVANRQLVGRMLSRHDELLLIEKLVTRGLERTPKGLRAPLADQVAAAVAGTSPIPLSALPKCVSGSTAAEVKRTALQLVDAGSLALVAGSRVDAITVKGAHLLDPDEVAAIRDLSKRLTKLVARLRSRKGTPSKTLARSEAQTLFGPVLEMLAAPNAAAGIATARVLETLAELERSRGRSVFVPDLVRALGTTQAPAPAHQALLALARAGRVELRPESGVGALSPADRALCPADAQGLVISYARVISGETA